MDEAGVGGETCTDTEVVCEAQERLATPSRVYEHLHETQLRLLEFEPTSTPDDLKLSVMAYDRGDAPSYTALSYEWGSPEGQHQILVNGKPFAIRHNLRLALQCLPSNLTLWVDALCVDQNNTVERNHQVRSMGEIYRDAASVVAWLGSYDQDLRGCFEPHASYSWATLIRSCKSVMLRTYWSRLWIWQELALSRKTLLRAGGHAIPFAEFRDHVERNATTWTDLTYAACNVVSKGAGLSLFEALQTFGDRACCEPRDRVFGLLNLVEPTERERLSHFFPDYTLSMESVVLMTLVHIRRCPRNLLAPNDRQYSLATNAAGLLSALGGRDKGALESLQRDLAEQERRLRRSILRKPALRPQVLKAPVPASDISSKVLEGLGIRIIDIYECLFGNDFHSMSGASSAILSLRQPINWQRSGLWVSDDPTFDEPNKLDPHCNAPVSFQHLRATRRPEKRRRERERKELAERQMWAR